MTILEPHHAHDPLGHAYRCQHVDIAMLGERWTQVALLLVREIHSLRRRAFGKTLHQNQQQGAASIDAKGDHE